MKTIHDFIEAATDSYVSEIDRLIGEENLSIAQLEINKNLAVERHEVERDQIIKWANDLCADRIIATRQQFDELIKQGVGRVVSLEQVGRVIGKAEILECRAKQPSVKSFSLADGSKNPLPAADDALGFRVVAGKVHMSVTSGKRKEVWSQELQRFLLPEEIDGDSEEEGEHRVVIDALRGGPDEI